VVGVAIAGAAAAALLVIARSPGPHLTLTATDDGYRPSRVTVKPGTTVTFVNQGARDRWPASNIHPTHEIYPEFDPRRPIPPGGSWSFAFQQRGLWHFHDHLDPHLGGSITVE
jgi:plastocyanin